MDTTKETTSDDGMSTTPLGSISEDLELDEFCRSLVEGDDPIVSADLPAAPSSSCDSASVDLPTNLKLLNIYSDYSSNSDESMQTDLSRPQLLRKIVDNQARFFAFAKNASTSSHLISSLCQLCHLGAGASSNDLAHFTWVQLFIQMFNILAPKQQQMLYGELTPFIASGSHVIQKQLIPHSTLSTFVESFSLAKPVALYLRPQLLSYLAKNHCLWHRGIMLLENSLAYTDTVPIDQAAQHETFAALSQLFGLLREDDFRAGLWLARTPQQPHSVCQDATKLAIVYEQQGLFYQVIFRKLC